MPSLEPETCSRVYLRRYMRLIKQALSLRGVMMSRRSCWKCPRQEEPLGNPLPNFQERDYCTKWKKLRVLVLGWKLSNDGGQKESSA